MARAISWASAFSLYSHKAEARGRERLPDNAPCPKPGCGRPRERDKRGGLICRTCSNAQRKANHEKKSPFQLACKYCGQAKTLGKDKKYRCVPCMKPENRPKRPLPPTP